MRIGDSVSAYAEKVRQITLRAVLFRAQEGDEFEARFNGVTLPLVIRDHQWKDKNIFSPAPQPPSGGADSYRINPEQKLLRLDFAVLPRLCNLGENQVSLHIIERATHSPDGDIVIEKLEVHVDYD